MREGIDVKDLISNTQPDGTVPEKLAYLDLRLGHTCNIKCIMCSPHDSSSWIKDWKIQTPQYTNNILKEDQGWDRTMDYTWYKKGSFIESMKSQIKNIKELYFAGGEPLLIPEHNNILEWLVAEGHSKDVILRYNSNGTEISNKLLDTWSKFKLVYVEASIDGIAEQFEYIRWPLLWD